MKYTVSTTQIAPATQQRPGARHQGVSLMQAQRTTPEYREEDRGYETPCWIWQKYRVSLPTGHDYGQKWDGTQRRLRGAHVVYYERAKGPVPSGHDVHHRCEVPSCVNPNHLVALDRERHSQSREDPRSILTATQVAQIKRIWLDGDRTQKSIGQEFSVSKECIAGIVSGRRWKNVEPAVQVQGPGFIQIRAGSVDE